MEKHVCWEAVSSRLEKAKARTAERAREDEKSQEEDDGMNDSEAVDMYLDSENEESEAECGASMVTLYAVFPFCFSSKILAVVLIQRRMRILNKCEILW